MNKAKGVALLTMGLMLIGFGLGGAGLLVPEASRLMAGSLERSIWFVPGGLASTAMGLLSIRYPGRF